MGVEPESSAQLGSQLFVIDFPAGEFFPVYHYNGNAVTEFHLELAAVFYVAHFQLGAGRLDNGGNLLFYPFAGTAGGAHHELD